MEEEYKEGREEGREGGREGERNSATPNLIYQGTRCEVVLLLLV